MKKQIITIIAIVIASLSFGQVDPSSTFNYKALITENGNPLINHPVNIRFTINAGNDIYQETQNTTTDANGIVITTIGDGTVNFGNFETIDWQGMHFLKVEINTGNGYQIFSNEPLHSVPYASYADKANYVENVNFNQLTNVPAGLSDGDDVNDADHSTTNEIQHLSISSNQISLSNGGGTVTLPDQHDADFYKAGTTTPPTSINDDIYTQGSLEIKSNNGSLLVLSSATNNYNIRPGIQFKNNTSQYIAGDDASNEIFGFYSKWGSHRTHDARLRVYGKASGSGSWGKYIEITHDGTDATIKTDTGNISLEPQGGEVQIPGKITAPATGNNDLKAFAYGTIDWNGSTLSGTGNFHVDHNLGAGIYKISFTGENYDDSHFTTVVSVHDTYWPSFIFCYATNNTLVVKIFDADGTTKENKPFSFVTYKN